MHLSWMLSTFFFLLSPCVTVAAELDYPELMVVPRASERLKIESEREAGFSLVSWPILLPAIASMGLAGANAGSIDSRDPYRISVLAPGAAGLLWTGVSVYLAAAWKPYRSAASSLKDPGSSKREQLARERLAEEALESAARTSFVLGVTATVTMAATSLLSSTVASSQTGFLLSVGTAVISLFPVVFPMRQHGIYGQHLEYKKKIYGPIAGAAILSEPVSGRPSPSLLVRFTL